MDLDLTERGKEMMGIWADFITRWAFQGERWWHTDSDGLCEEDDIAMRDREREARNLDLMRYEDESMKKIRSHELAVERRVMKRETKLMRWEDQHARAIRDRVMFCRFFDNMSTRADLMSNVRSRFARGLGIDNGDEIREKRRIREALELEEMRIEEREMRAFLDHERKRREAAWAKQQAELERLRRERMRSKMFAIVMRQRELDRQRREDRDGLTYEEREQVERATMQVQDVLSSGLRTHVKNLERLEMERRREIQLQDLERRQNKERERQRVESALRERLASRRFEARERVRMSEEDVESRMFELEIDRILSDRRYFEDLITLGAPFYKDDNDDVVLFVPPQTKSVLRVGSKVRPGQEWLKYASSSGVRGDVVKVQTITLKPEEKNQEEEKEEKKRIVRFVPPVKKRVVAVEKDEEEIVTNPPFYRGHFGLVGKKKTICSSPVSKTSERRKRKTSKPRPPSSRVVVGPVALDIEKKRKDVVKSSIREDDRRVVLQQQLCKWGDDDDDDVISTHTR